MAITGVRYRPRSSADGGDYRQLAGLNGTSDVWTMYKGPDQITWTCQGGKLHRYDRFGKRSGSYGIGDLGLPPSLTRADRELKYVFRLPDKALLLVARLANARGLQFIQIDAERIGRGAVLRKIAARCCSRRSVRRRLYTNSRVPSTGSSMRTRSAQRATTPTWSAPSATVRRTPPRASTPAARCSARRCWRRAMAKRTSALT